MIDPETELALLESIESSMGIYPQTTNGKPRTEWQDGWNAYGKELSAKKIKVLNWFEKLPKNHQSMISEMLIVEDIFIQDTDSGPASFFLTSDLFAWGYADWERIDGEEMLKTIYSVWKEKGSSGISAWWCKHENEQPQWPVEKRWRENGVWDDELEKLPHCKYDENIGRWKNKNKDEVVAELLRTKPS